MKNTVLISFYGLLWSFPVPIILSLIINQVRFHKFKRVVQTVLYAPHFISVMVICGMIKIFLSPTGGLLNLLLGTQIDFLTQSEAFRTIYIASGIWQDAGWGCIIYLATLANADPRLYEADHIHRLRHLAGRGLGLYHLLSHSGQRGPRPLRSGQDGWSLGVPADPEY